MSRAIPMVGDVPLNAVQRVRHAIEQGFARLPIEGLDGELVQAHGRRSHAIEVEGLLVGATAKADLETLQLLAQGGEEQTFTLDILTALELQKVVVTSMVASESAGLPGTYAYRLALVESPPLPPPAEVSPFGGFDDFGLGDLGFDTDLLGDIAGDIMDGANAVAAAAEEAMDAVEQITALVGAAQGLGGVGDPTRPLREEIGKLAGPAGKAAGAVEALVTALFGTGGG